MKSLDDEFMTVPKDLKEATKRVLEYSATQDPEVAAMYVKNYIAHKMQMALYQAESKGEVDRLQKLFDEL